MLPRNQYLKKLIDLKDNGRVKIITGLRRSGKSVLLLEIYRDYLIGEGIQPEQIISVALDDLSNARYRNPMELDDFFRKKITDGTKNTICLLMKYRWYRKSRIRTWMILMLRSGL